MSKEQRQEKLDFIRDVLNSPISWVLPNDVKKALHYVVDLLEDIGNRSQLDLPL